MPELLRKLPTNIKKNKLRSGIIVGLSAYWGLIIVGTVVSLIRF
tara:strand:+ start:315 stop:446 length:132 start_codon:yes stop_codon:yes gene_type:complete